MNFCGLDVGTSGVKAVVFNEKGLRAADAYRAYETEYDPDGLRGLDPREMWKKTKEVLREACVKAGRIDALAAASFGEAFVMLDEKDEPLHDIMIFTDPRGEEEFISASRGIPHEEIARVCGLPFSPTYSISKLLYLKRRRAELYGRAKRILFIEDYVGYMLSGSAAVDYSVASRSMLFNVRSCTWSGKMMERFGIEEGLFSRPVPAGTVIGTVSPAVAAELGVPETMKIVAGIHDQPASAIGTGLGKGSVACSMGTSECLTPIFTGIFEPADIVRNGLSSEPVWEAGKYCTLAYNPSCGVLIEWFFRTFAAAETAAGGPPFALFEENFPEKPTRLTVQPYLAGSGTPYLDTHARFAVTGAGLETTRFDLYRGVLEGLVLDQYLNLELLCAQGVPAESLICVGGGSKSRPWLQVKADVMQLLVSTLLCSEAGALGCAALCAVALGVYGSVEEAAGSMSHRADTLEPNREHREFYKEKFEEYRTLHARLKAGGDC